MSEFQKEKITKKKPEKNKDEVENHQNLPADEKRRRLKKLDDFIADVLQEAGNEFLDEFKQIEGE